MLQKSCSVITLLRSRIQLWNQDLKRPDINLRWSDCWNLKREITVNKGSLSCGKHCAGKPWRELSFGSITAISAPTNTGYI